MHSGAPFGDSMGFPFIALKFIPYYYLLRCALYDYVMFIPFDLIQRPRLGNLLCFGNDITYTTYLYNLVPRVLSYPPSLSLRRAGRREPWERGCYLYFSFFIVLSLFLPTVYVLLSFNILHNFIFTLNVYRQLFQNVYFLSRFWF